MREKSRVNIGDEVSFTLACGCHIVAKIFKVRECGDKPNCISYKEDTKSIAAMSTSEIQNFQSCDPTKELE